MKAIALAILMLSIPSLLCASNHILSAEDQTRMYLVIIRRLLGPDDTYGGVPVPPSKVYIDQLLFDSSPVSDVSKLEEIYKQMHAKPPLPPPPPVELSMYPGGDLRYQVKMPPEIISALKASLVLPTYKTYWVTDGDKTLKFDKLTGGIDGGGEWIVLSAPTILPDNRVFVYGWIYFGHDVSGTTYYFFKASASGWRLDKVIEGPVS